MIKFEKIPATGAPRQTVERDWDADEAFVDMGRSRPLPLLKRGDKVRCKTWSWEGGVNMDFVATVVRQVSDSRVKIFADDGHIFDVPVADCEVIARAEASPQDPFAGCHAPRFTVGGGR